MSWFFRHSSFALTLLLSVLAVVSMPIGDTTASAQEASQPDAATAADTGGNTGAKAVEAAQDAAAPKESLIDLAELRQRLRPLTKEELVKEADAWRDRLKAKVSEIVESEIAAGKAEGEGSNEIRERLSGLRDERTQIGDRLQAVLDEILAKGGKPEEVAAYENYRSAVSGIVSDVTDVSATWTAITGWAQSKEGGLRWGKNIIFFFVTLLVFKLLASFLAGVTRRAVSRAAKASDLLKEFFVNTVRRLVFLVGVVLALSMLEVNIAPLLAGMGAVGFIVAFALQGTLSNFAAGTMILLYRPYDVGDVVTAAGVTGKVNSMSLVSTTLKTPDNQTVVVPNGSIWGDVITNITGNDTRRVDLVFGIGYGDDIAKAQKILEELATSHPKTLDDPAPVIRVNELADSSVNFVCRPWSKTSDYWDVYWDLTRQVKERFDAEGISIPFPQQDIYIHQIPAPSNG